MVQSAQINTTAAQADSGAGPTGSADPKQMNLMSGTATGGQGNSGLAPPSFVAPNSRNMFKQQAVSSGNMRPNSLNEGAFQPMQSQTPVGHGGNALNDASAFNQQIMANRKAKFMQHQASKSSNPNNSQMLAQGNSTKHKVNLSTDLVANN